MYCDSCKELKDPDRFEFIPDTNTRERTCKPCRKFLNRIAKLKQEISDTKEQGKNLLDLWKECIEACEVKNSRRLRLTVDKAKLEIGVFRTRDEVL